jgi:hypothetical protein
MISKMDAHHKEMMAIMKSDREETKACLVLMEACLEKREANPEETRGRIRALGSP